MIEDYPKTLLELEERFATDEQCRAYLVRLRRAKSLAGATWTADLCQLSSPSHGDRWHHFPG